MVEDAPNPVANTHMHTHKHARTLMHARTHTQAHTEKHANADRHIYTCMHPHARAQTSKCTQIHRPTNMQTQLCPHTHTHTHTDTPRTYQYQMHTCKYIFTCTDTHALTLHKGEDVETMLMLLLWLICWLLPWKTLPKPHWKQLDLASGYPPEKGGQLLPFVLLLSDSPQSF